MRNALCCLLFASVAGTAASVAAEGTPHDEAARQLFREEVSRQRPTLLRELKQRIVEATDLLRRCKSGSISTSLTEPAKAKAIKGRVVIQFQSQKTKKAAIAEASAALQVASADLKAAMDGTGTLIPTVTRPLKTGQVGRLDPPMIFISQIIDGQNVLGKVPLDGRKDGVQQRTLVWLRGVDTTDLTDDSTAVLSVGTIYKVAGNKQYSTAIGGTNTVMMIDAISLDEFKDWIEKENRPKP